jgi:acetamidase/formamidase
VECAMNTVLIVELLREVATPWPRLESDTHIMSVGASRPLEDAYRVANVDLVDWVSVEYKVDRLDAYQIVAQLAQAPIAQVCNPIYTVVSKLAKDLLPSGSVYRGMHAALREQSATYQAGRL